MREVFKEYLQTKDCIYLRAASRNLEQKYMDAIQEYQKILKLKPNDPWTLNNIALIYLDLKNFEKTIEFATKALEVREFGMGWSSLYWAYFSQGRQFLKDGNRDKALEVVNKIDVDKSEQRLAENLAGDAFFMYQDTDLLLKTLQKNLKKFPNALKSNYLMGEYLLSTNDAEEASKYFKKAYENFDKNYETNIHARGRTLLALIRHNLFIEKKYEEALSYLDQLKVIAVPANVADILGYMHYYRGLCLHELGWNKKDLSLSKEALASYREAIRVFPDLKQSVVPNIVRLESNIKNFTRISNQ